MKKMIAVMMAVGLLSAASALTAEKPVKGEDLVEVPATTDGLCVHNLFQSNMVLQRDKPIFIWGWANPGEKVTVTFDGKSAAATAGENRVWKAELPAMPASSEPRKMTIQGKDKTVELENILVGDIWLLGGQSNMEFEIAKVDGGSLEIVSANFPEIRLMTIPQQNGPDTKKAFPSQYQWSGWFGRHFRQGYWDVCSPATVRDMSAIGYIFGRRIHMATQVPIGLIDISRGGTCIETWLPIDLLKSIDTKEVKAQLAEWDAKVSAYNPKDELERAIRHYNDRTEQTKKAGGDVSNRKPPTEPGPGPAMDMNRPGNCYAGIIGPIAGLQVKGAIWHQGFNNAMQPNGHAMYYQLMPKLISAWRTAFSAPNMAFGIISLCTCGEPQNEDDYLEKMVDEGIYIREVQYKTFLDMRKAGDKNVGYASSFDLRRAWFHPQIKIPAGERIACWALATQYGMSKDLQWEPPTCKEMKIDQGTIVLKMSSEVRPYNDGPILGFAIAGKDGKYQMAKAEYLLKGDKGSKKPDYDRSAIVLSSPLVPEPVHYRHAWSRNPLTNLKAGDIPFATQRSDSWKLADMYEIYTGKKTKTPDILDRSESRQLTEALKAEDMKRRQLKAKTLIGK